LRAKDKALPFWLLRVHGVSYKGAVVAVDVYRKVDVAVHALDAKPRLAAQIAFFRLD